MRAAITCAALLALARPLAAQDFAPAAGAGPVSGACALLERALPAPEPQTLAEALTAAWEGVPQLRTRALAAAAHWRSARVAAGLSQTGEPEWGWTCVALAAGAAHRTGGCALRLALTADRTAPFAQAAQAPALAGVTLGGGAWLAPGPGVRVWAQAPQCATRGAPPPLVRPLELGASLAREAARVWFALEAPGRGGDGERALGVALARGPCELWTEARDGPWRAALGVNARVRAITCALRADAHPLLGTRTTLVLGVGAGARR